MVKQEQRSGHQMYEVLAQEVDGVLEFQIQPLDAQTRRPKGPAVAYWRKSLGELPQVAEALKEAGREAGAHPPDVVMWILSVVPDDVSRSPLPLRTLLQTFVNKLLVEKYGPMSPEEFARVFGSRFRVAEVPRSDY